MKIVEKILDIYTIKVKITIQFKWKIKKIIKTDFVRNAKFGNLNEPNIAKSVIDVL